MNHEMMRIRYMIYIYIYIYCICIYLICSTCPTWHVLEFLFCHCNSSWLACSSQHFKSSMFCFRHVLCTPTLQRFCPLETIFGLENKGEAEAHKTCRAAGKRPIATYGYGSGASGRQLASKADSGCTRWR